MSAAVPRPAAAEERALAPTIPQWPGYPLLIRLLLVLKRIFDIVAALGLLLVSAPIFLVLAIWIPLDSSGPVLFKNKRRGRHGRTFEVFKFRTMQKEAHRHREKLVNSKGAGRLLFKIKGDPRVTKLGQFLRKYSLDELPQLLNVLRGDMSLIGPRPLLKEDFEGAYASDPLFRRWVRDRHQLRPGITGLWQVSGRNDLTFEASMLLDLEYVTYWSPWMDFIILLRTPIAVLQGKGAY
jgi:lipopolysaccharide/colanic/teichoic acid biosynthesis glycosyltransferase